MGSISRRKLLVRGVQVSVGGVLASAVAGQAAAATCVDTKTMDAGEQSTRNELHWVAATKNPDQPCTKCGFYMSTSADCGTCMIFNGATTPQGHCDSWAAKS